MAEKLDPKELINLKELLMSEVIQSEALIKSARPEGDHLEAGTPGGDEKGTSGLAEK